MFRTLSVLVKQWPATSDLQIRPAVVYSAARWHPWRWFGKFTVQFWPFRKEILSWMYNNTPYYIIIMCGYQCDKAVTKNDTLEVIWYHFSLQWNDIISLHGLNCLIKWTVIIWLDQSGCMLCFSCRLVSNFAGRIVLQFSQQNVRFKNCTR